MKKVMPFLYSLAQAAKPDLPPRAEIMPKIESGEIDHIDFPATVFQNGPLRNPFEFRSADLPAFAASFTGLPFLRDHDQNSIDSRDGTILSSEMIGDTMHQTIRLTTRKGMTAFIEGQIDRFSIGWHPPEQVLCSICGTDWLQCSHMPGRKYKTAKGEKPCLLVMVKPVGKETSAVNSPASDGTGLLSELAEYKLEVSGNHADTHAQGASKSSLTKGGQMATKKKVKVMVTNSEGNEEEAEGVLVTEPSSVETQIEANRLAAAELLGETERQQQMDAQLAQSNETLVAMCEHLLSTGLATSKLPELTQARIRKQFTGKMFKAPELQSAITEAREEITALTQSDNIHGPSRFSGMFNSADQFKLAIEDMFGVEREASQANVKVHKLQGIQDAYLKATGDQFFMGGYYPSFALVSANFPAIVANVMNKMLIQAWADYEEVYGWWKDVATVEHFTNLNDVTWVKTGTIASLPTINERGEYTELPVGDSKETSSWGKSGGYVPLTIESILRDDLRAFTRMPKEAALAGIRNVSEKVAEIFTQASGAGPTMYDGGALFNATAQTTVGGHGNLLTTALGTDYTAWNAVATAMFKKKLFVKSGTGNVGTGKPQGIKPSICLVPADLITQAEALFMPRWASQVESTATAGGPSYGGKVKPIAVPEWTDATDWAAVINPKLVPGVMIGEIFGVKPQIFSASSEIDPAMFANDESRIKVRQFLNVGVADDMPLHKNNVAG